MAVPPALIMVVYFCNHEMHPVPFRINSAAAIFYLLLFLMHLEER